MPQPGHRILNSATIEQGGNPAVDASPCHRGSVSTGTRHTEPLATQYPSCPCTIVACARARGGFAQAREDRQFLMKRAFATPIGQSCQKVDFDVPSVREIDKVRSEVDRPL